MTISNVHIPFLNEAKKLTCDLKYHMTPSVYSILVHRIASKLDEQKKWKEIRRYRIEEYNHDQTRWT